MDNVYRKTERGLAEIATRQHKLAPRLRSALVVVDGKRSDLELASMIAGRPQETLQALLDAGFIELANDNADQAAAARAGAAVPALAPAAEEPEAATPVDIDASALTLDEGPGYAPTQPLDDLAPGIEPAPVARPRPAIVRSSSPVVPARTLEATKRHVMQWLTEHLGTYADSTNRRIERCDTSEALSSAVLVARAVVEQQLGAETAKRFESEMFAALRRGAAP